MEIKMAMVKPMVMLSILNGFIMIIANIISTYYYDVAINYDDSSFFF